MSEIQVCEYSSIKVTIIEKQLSCASEMWSLNTDKSPLHLF